MVRPVLGCGKGLMPEIIWPSATMGPSKTKTRHQGVRLLWKPQNLGRLYLFTLHEGWPSLGRWPIGCGPSTKLSCRCAFQYLRNRIGRLEDGMLIRKCRGRGDATKVVADMPTSLSQDGHRDRPARSRANGGLGLSQQPPRQTYRLRSKRQSLLANEI